MACGVTDTAWLSRPSRGAAGQDAIVSALGRSTSIRAEKLFGRATSAVVAAANEIGVSRLIWLSSFGVGETFIWSSTAQKPAYSTSLRSIYADNKMSEEEIRSSGLDWTVVYPTQLSNGPPRARSRPPTDISRIRTPSHTGPFSDGEMVAKCRLGGSGPVQARWNVPRAKS
ncbi:NAD(P)-dependent oxidoreductase [Kribbella sp. NPDC050124]|uniref:NAD(P)-dependent oxidoreductase n=1 Tax=Kribbella sp. NPDC050124 TaxID=3364114 RepID=UPI0037956BCC